jgi:hypothetical protein
VVVPQDVLTFGHDFIVTTPSLILPHLFTQESVVESRSAAKRVSILTNFVPARYISQGAVPV